MSLADEQKMVFLSMLSHDLTIHGRAFALDLDGQQLIDAFKRLNELQHQISSQIVGIGTGKEHYSDEAIWEIVLSVG